EESKLTTAAGGADLLSGHLRLYQRLADRTGDAADLTPALAAAERNRARVFLDALASSSAGLLAGAPAGLRDRERDLRAKIRAIDRNTRALLDRQARRADPEFSPLLARFDADRARAEDDLRELVGQIAKIAPGYKALKYPEPCTVEDARAALAKDEV